MNSLEWLVFRAFIIIILPPESRLDQVRQQRDYLSGEWFSAAGSIPWRLERRSINGVRENGIYCLYLGPDSFCNGASVS